MFLNPFLIGGIFILISDTTSFDRINASISASLIFISYLILLKIILAIILNKKYLKEIKIKNESNDANNSHSKILTQDNEFHSIEKSWTRVWSRSSRLTRRQPPANDSDSANVPVVEVVEAVVERSERNRNPFRANYVLHSEE